MGWMKYSVFSVYFFCMQTGEWSILYSQCIYILYTGRWMKYSVFSVYLFCMQTGEWNILYSQCIYSICRQVNEVFCILSVFILYAEFRSRVKVEVAVLSSPSIIKKRSHGRKASWEKRIMYVVLPLLQSMKPRYFSTFRPQAPLSSNKIHINIPS